MGNLEKSIRDPERVERTMHKPSETQKRETRGNIAEALFEEKITRKFPKLSKDKKTHFKNTTNPKHWVDFASGGHVALSEDILIVMTGQWLLLASCA